MLQTLIYLSDGTGYLRCNMSRFEMFRVGLRSIALTAPRASVGAEVLAEDHRSARHASRQAGTAPKTGRRKLVLHHVLLGSFGAKLRRWQGLGPRAGCFTTHGLPAVHLRHVLVDSSARKRSWSCMPALRCTLLGSFGRKLHRAPVTEPCTAHIVRAQTRRRARRTNYLAGTASRRRVFSETLS